MGLWNKYPFTNFHEVNTDWIIREVRELKEAVQSTKTELESDMLALAKQVTNIQNDVNSKLDRIDSSIAQAAAEEVQRLVAGGAFDELITPALDKLTQDLQAEIASAKGMSNTALVNTNKITYLNRLRNKQILIIGDSNSDESYTSSAGTLTKHWTGEFKKIVSSQMSGNGTTVTNKSKSGARMVYAKEQLTTINATSTRYDIILIMLGTNDYGHSTPVADFRTTLGEIAKLLQPHITARKTEVYIVSPPKRTLANRDVAGHVPLVIYARELYNWATRNGFNFIDCWCKMPELDMTSDSSRKQWLVDSSLHFSDAYAPIFANWILGYLAENKSDTIGDYYEEYRATCMRGWFTNVNNFTFNETYTYVKVGTRDSVLRVVGMLKSGGGNTTGLQPIGHMPDWLIGFAGFTYLNGLYTDLTRHNVPKMNVALINNTDKLMYADITGQTSTGKTCWMVGVLPALSNQLYDL